MPTEKQKIEDRIRINEIRMAVSFIAIVTVFFICHSVWLASSVSGAFFDWASLNKDCHNPKNTKTRKACDEMLEPWYIILTYASRFLMVLNSSVNILLYAVVWNQFREEAMELLTSILGIIKHPTKTKSYKSNTDETASTTIPLTKI